MKLLKILEKNSDKSYSENNFQDKIYSFLCLENKHDLQLYHDIDLNIKSKQAVGFWMGLKSQPSHYTRTAINYLAHENRCNHNGIASLMAVKLHTKQGETSVVEYCQEADNIIGKIHYTQLSLINSGSMIRINESGGYCPINTLENYLSIEDINEQEMHNWILHKDIKSKFEISSETIVIENDSRIPKKLIEKYCKENNENPDNIQVITSFKFKSILFKPEDYIKFFSDGIKNHNLKNIVIETTAQDMSQVKSIKDVFEYVMSKIHPDKHLNVHVMLHCGENDVFSTKVSNITLKFIK
jgi:hypothetical protein